MFIRFNYGLVPTQDILIIWVPQIGESTYGVLETSKLSAIGFISLFPIGVFT
jgi:hypothetical protein